MVRYLDLFHGKFHITIASDIDVSHEDLRRLDSWGNACHVYKLGYVCVLSTCICNTVVFFWTFDMYAWEMKTSFFENNIFLD